MLGKVYLISELRYDAFLIAYQARLFRAEYQTIVYKIQREIFAHH